MKTAKKKPVSKMKKAEAKKELKKTVNKIRKLTEKMDELMDYRYYLWWRFYGKSRGFMSNRPYNWDKR